MKQYSCMNSDKMFLLMRLTDLKCAGKNVSSKWEPCSFLFERRIFVLTESSVSRRTKQNHKQNRNTSNQTASRAHSKKWLPWLKMNQGIQCTVSNEKYQVENTNSETTSRQSKRLTAVYRSLSAVVATPGLSSWAALIQMCLVIFCRLKHLIWLQLIAGLLSLDLLAWLTIPVLGALILDVSDCLHACTFGDMIWDCNVCKQPCKFIMVCSYCA